MEDKNKKPVDVKQLKNPTGKSVTGKPLDGIEIRPQLKGLGNRQHNEDTVVLTDTLAEKKALTLVQRQRRARILRAKEPKMQRAKEVAQHRLASEDKLKARAINKARNLVKMRFSARRGTPYTELTTSEKIQVDKVVDKKVKLIRKLAARLLPSLRKAEVNRLASFQSGAKLQHATAGPVVNEQFNNIVESLDNKTSMQLVDIIGDSIDALNENNNSMGITLKRLLNAVLPEDAATSTLIQKAERTGIPFSTLREVFERGSFAWENDGRTTQEQFSFARVNSYIAKGKAWTLDADLREEKLINDKLDSIFESAYHAGLSASTAKKREAHWKKMEKYSDKDDRAYQDAPGDKEARKKPMPQSVHTKKYHAMYGEDVNEGLWANIHAKRKRIAAGSGERMRKPGSKGAPTQAGLKSAQEAVEDQVGNRIADTTKHGKISYVGVRTAAHKETGTQERQEIQYIKRHKNIMSKEKDVDPQQIRIAHDQINKKIIDESSNTPYVKPHIEKGSTNQSGWKASNKHGKVKYFGLDFKASAHKHAGINEDTSADREVGTKSLTKKYQKETPGQEKADMNEIFNTTFHEDIERRSDFRMVKVRTPTGFVWRKTRKEADVEREAE
jgi:hypothetical protein